MKTLHLILASAAVAIFGLSGCKTASTYRITPLHHETMRDELDAQWFQREVYDKQGKLEAVELTYCPMRPGKPTVCRTSVVWRRNASALIGVGPTGN